jgi:HTH-type transcriptional regulator/antitoxin HipB
MGVQISKTGGVRDPVALGEAIRSRRKALDITQADLAVVARTTQRYVSEIERGKDTARIGGVFRLLEVLGLEVTVGPK